MLIYYVNDIPTDLADKVEEYVLSEDIPWVYVKNSINKKDLCISKIINIETKGFKIRDHSFFGSMLCWEREPNEWIGVIEELSNYLVDYFGHNLVYEKFRTGRILANMTFPRNTAVGTIQYPHPDCGKGGPYYSFLYYPTDSDGDTYFFDDNDELIAKASPLKGTGVLFDSNMYHAGSLPVHNERRIAINFMFGRLKYMTQ